MPSHLAPEMQEEAASLIQEQQAPHRGRALKAVAALACVVGAAACGRALAGAQPAKSLAAGAVSMQEDAAAVEAVGGGAGEAGETWVTAVPAAVEDADAASGDEGAGVAGDDGGGATGENLGEAEMDNYCPAEGEDCSRKRCCAKPGLQCYKKNDEWAGCMTNCTKGMRMAGDMANETWDCEEFGPMHPEPIDEDYSYCAPRGQDCRHTHCCAGADDYCYLKNAAWGSCMMKCDPSASLTEEWECTKLY